jgi:hypothetical protein
MVCADDVKFSTVMIHDGKISSTGHENMGAERDFFSIFCSEVNLTKESFSMRSSLSS